MFVVRSTNARVVLLKLQDVLLNDTDKLTHLDRFIRACVARKDFAALNEVIKELGVSVTSLLLLQVSVRRLLPFKEKLESWNIFLEEVYSTFKTRGMCISYFVPELNDLLTNKK